MGTYNEFEHTVFRTRDLLREPRTVLSAADWLEGRDRRELLRLGYRLSSLLDELSVRFSAESLTTLTDEDDLEELVSRLGYLQVSLEKSALPADWSGEIRGLIHAAGRAVRFAESRFSQHKSARSHSPFELEPFTHETAEATTPVDIAEPPQRVSRYANAVLFAADSVRPIELDSPIVPRTELRLRLDIGDLSRESQVESPVPFPDQALPDEDVWLDVMVGSSHFTVWESGSAERGGSTAHGKFLLPRNGSPAVAPDGARYLTFGLRAPADPRERARVRVGYYFRGAIIQSQVVVADVGYGPGSVHILTDFSVTQTPADLGAIRDRPRVSVFANSDGTGAHQVTIRSRGSDGKIGGAGFDLDEATIGLLVGSMRATLRGNGVAPTTRRRSRAQLKADLRAIAPQGWKLWTALPGQFMEVWDALYHDPENAVLQVARSTASAFTFPWTLIYDFPLDSAIASGKLPVCPVVEQWDERSPLFEGSPRECPAAGQVPHRDLLCPFGFGGFRYSLEQITSSESPVTAIDITAAPRLVIAETQVGVNKEQLATHVLDVGKALRTLWPSLTVKEGKDKKTLRDAIEPDLPLLYFFCHGQRTNSADPETYLGIGNREQLTAPDFIGWLQDWRKEKRKVWNLVRPLVFINACHSVEINPATLVSYLQAFVGSARAAGVIGTEVKVAQGLAMEFATTFFTLLAQPGWTVDRALRQVRLDFLRDANLFGLLYTPYCWADLELR
jgi:hypothetical protein